MASTIAAGTSAGTAIAISGDTSGALQLQTNGTTTAVTLDTSQNATFAGKVTSAGALTLASNGTTTAVTIDTSQNVGIGTASPAQKLDITGNAAVSGQLMAGTTTTYSDGTIGTPRLQWRAATGNYVGAVSIADTTSALDHWVLRNPNGNIGSISTNGTSFVFNTAATERMRIDSSGNVTAGGTTSYGKITSAASSGYCFGTDSVGNGADHFRFTSGGGTTTGSITRVGGTNVAYNTSSDYRLKYNISPMTGALNKVAKLKPCTYTWRLDDSDGEGFIAHELAEVCPHAVAGEKDAVDENGDIKAQGIDTSFLVATLTAAIQEQQALIIQLQADVAALKGVK